MNNCFHHMDICPFLMEITPKQFIRYFVPGCNSKMDNFLRTKTPIFMSCHIKIFQYTLFTAIGFPIAVSILIEGALATFYTSLLSISHIIAVVSQCSNHYYSILTVIKVLSQENMLCCHN